MRYIPILLILLTLFGFTECKVREKQAAANALVGVDALTGVGEELIAEGTKTNIETAVGESREELPVPEFTLDQIKQDQGKQYLGKAKKDQKEAFSFGWKSWLLTGGLIITGIMKFIPGAHKPVVAGINMLLENATDKKERKREEQLSRGARYMVDAIEACAPKEVKDYVNRKVPSEVNDAIKEYLESRA